MIERMTPFWSRAALVLGAAFLVSCDGGGPSRAGQYGEGEAIAVAGGRAYSEDAGRPAPPPKAPGPQGSDVAPEGALLAYSYSMGIAAPKGAIEPMSARHQALCVAAGPQRCQVLGASVNRWGEDQVRAHLNLRAAPDWLEEFRADIAGDADAAGGKITSNTVNAEDLTNFIVDLDARLEAKQALRERIRNLLETQEGSLSDILAAERALADVQGEIDSMTARLKAARARVAMSVLNVSYASDPETSVGIFKPLGEAFGDFARTSVESVASAVRFFARAWPFFLLLLGALAILRVWWRGRRKA